MYLFELFLRASDVAHGPLVVFLIIEVNVHVHILNMNACHHLKGNSEKIWRKHKFPE